MRISDWSSDVCSSDLPVPVAVAAATSMRVWMFMAPPGAEQPPSFRSRLTPLPRRGRRPELPPSRENCGPLIGDRRSEEHTSELQSLMRISYAVFCLKKKTKTYKHTVQDRKKTENASSQ